MEEGQQHLSIPHLLVLLLVEEVVQELVLQLKQGMVSVGRNNILEVLVHITHHRLDSTIWEVVVLDIEVEGTATIVE